MDSEKEGQITAQIGKQEQAIGKLSDTISRLEEHLGALLLIQDNIKDIGEPEQELAARDII